MSINPIYAVAGGVTLAACISAAGFWWQALGLQAELQERDETIAALRVDIGRCSDQVRDQNSALKRMTENADAAREAGRQALEKARSVSRAQQSTIDALQARILRPPADAGCAAALGEIRSALGVEMGNPMSTGAQ